MSEKREVANKKINSPEKNPSKGAVFDTAMRQKMQQSSTGNFESKASSERQKYDTLQQNRIRDQKMAMSASSAKMVSTKEGASRKFGMRKSRKAKMSASPDTAMAAATAYKEINFSEDAAHIVVIVISIMADIGTLIPLFNWVVALLASVAIWVIYLLGGHLERRIGRKAIVSGIGYSIEFFPIASMLPAFISVAVINYWMALTEKRLKKIQNNEI